MAASLVGVDGVLPALDEVVEVAALAVGEGDVLKDAADGGGVIGGDGVFEGVVEGAGLAELVFEPAAEGDEDPGVVGHAAGLSCGRSLVLSARSRDGERAALAAMRAILMTQDDADVWQRKEVRAWQ